jgi:hypothetical protein
MCWTHSGSWIQVNIACIEDLQVFPYLERDETNADMESQPEPPQLPRTEIYSGAGFPQLDYIPQVCERASQRCLEPYQWNNPYYSFAMRDEYNYIQPVIKKNEMKM